MNKTEAELLWEKYQTIILEDLTSSKNQAKNILKNNGIENYEAIVEDLVKFLDEQRNRIEPDKRRWVSDAHLSPLAFLYIGGGASLNTLNTVKDEYIMYLDTPVFADKNEIDSFFQKAMAEIKNKKLFKPSEEKTQIINDFFRNFTSQLHTAHSANNSNKKDVVDQSSSLDGIDQNDIVYEDENIVVLLANSRAKTIKYGHPNLCISWKGSNNYYWRYRMGEMRDDGYGMTTYFVYEKDKVFQKGFIVDAQGNDDGPRTDGIYGYTPIPQNGDFTKNKEEIIKMYPYVKPAFDANVFQFILYGNMEKRYRYIEDSVNNITDDELKSSEDYYMFVEAGKKINPDEWSQIPKTIVKDIVVKYASVGLFFNIPKEIKEKYLTPSDRKNLDNKQLKAIKDFFKSI
jgi:hypothetical protein